MPNKLTDEQIKKAFECCYTDKGGCDECPYYSREENRCIEDGDFFDLPNKIFDLINRQDAENVSLKAEVERLQRPQDADPMDFCGVPCTFTEECIKKAKAELYKECIRKVKLLNRGNLIILNEQLDNLLNELVGDENGKDG